MDKDINVAIVGGTGSLGSGLALRLAAPGVRVIIGSRDREKAKTVVESLRKSLTRGALEGETNQEAIKEAEFVVIAVPYEGHATTVAQLKGQLAGKTVIDAVVPLKKGRPFVPAAGSALLEAQQILGDEAPVVGALHNISAVDLVGALHNISAVDLQSADAALGDVLVCGDNEAAKQKVMEVIRRIGARSFDAGPAANAYVIEGLTGVLISLNRKYKSQHASVKVTGIGE